MKIKMRKLNPNESYCCSLSEIKSIFQKDSIRIYMGRQQSRDEIVNSDLVRPNKTIKGMILAQIRVCAKRINRFGLQNSSYVNLYILNKSDFSDSLHKKFLEEVLPVLKKFYDTYKDTNVKEMDRAPRLTVSLYNGVFNFYEDTVVVP